VKTAKPFWLTRVAVIALLLNFMAACSDDTTGSDFQLDPESTAAIMEDLVADFFEGNEAATSLMYLGESIFQALGGGVPGLNASPPAEIAGGIPNHLFSNPVYRAAAANIPDIFEGVTFEWDEVEEGYLPSERTGAPANGVRFILYAVNPITGLPVSPLIEQGHLDISDATVWPNIDITLEAVVGTATLIYADVTGNVEDLNPWIDLDGYFSDGTDQLTFNAYATENQSGYFFEFGLGLDNFQAAWDMSYTEAGLALEVSFTDGTNTLVFSLALEEQLVGQEWVDVILEGSGITFNDVAVAVIEGWIGEDTIQITITNAAGDPLTAAELAALEDAFDAIDELSQFMEGMFEFAAQLAYFSQPIN
jgi:hypothetical protein